MQSITVSRYSDPKTIGWAGNIEPADKSSIMFIDLEGRPLVFLNRDPDGGVLSDDPSERAKQLAERGFTSPDSSSPDSSAPSDE